MRYLLEEGTASLVRHGHADKAASSEYKSDLERRTSQEGLQELRQCEDELHGQIPHVMDKSFAGLTLRTQDVCEVIAGQTPIIVPELTYLDPATSEGERLDAICNKFGDETTLHDFLHAEPDLTRVWMMTACSALRLYVDPKHDKHILIGMNGAGWIGSLAFLLAGGDLSPQALEFKRRVWRRASGATIWYRRGKKPRATFHPSEYAV